MRCPFRGVLGFLYIIGFAALLYFGWQGYTYYNLPLQERPHEAQLHSDFKPGGRIGHGVGILGSSMLLLLFIYSARKRQLLGLRFGPLQKWLSIHIWMGFMGPMFITLHTAMKFHGIVSISYFSMMAVMLSGFVGRYIYSQIPRSTSGEALSLKQIDEQIETMGQTLGGQDQVHQEILELTQAYAGRLEAPSGYGPGVWFRLLLYDCTRWFRPALFRRALREVVPDLSPAALKEMAQVAHTRSLLLRRRTFLNAVNSVFDLWHVVHKPFAWVAIIIMFLHITVVVLMGYRWIF
jgi:hypothetical protein